MKPSVLFVCLGNICRSPAAEGIFRRMCADAGVLETLVIDSAGTSAFHEGDPADRRMRHFASERGYELLHRARHFVAEDFRRFDLILTMDESNYANVLALDVDGTGASQVRKMVSFCRVHDVPVVPDPYYEGDDGFRLVLDILEDACTELLAFMRETYKI